MRSSGPAKESTTVWPAIYCSARDLTSCVSESLLPWNSASTKCETRLGCNRKEAIAYIEKVDQDRRKWTKFLYNVDWTDASLYDLVLNLEQMDLQEACEVICCASQLKCFEFTPECQRAVDDLALASLCQSESGEGCRPRLTYEFEVVAESGLVSVKGGILHPSQAQEIAAIVRAVPGVVDIGTATARVGYSYLKFQQARRLQQLL